MSTQTDFITIGSVVLAFIVGYWVISFLITLIRNRSQKSSFTDSTTGTAHREESDFGQRDEGPKRAYEERRQSYSRTTNQEANNEIYYGKILGLRGRITIEEVRRQYLVLAAQYHPDKVTHLGPKLRVLAEEEMKALNDAYDFFSKKYG
jgi:hypothetical protein